jgi:pilus assembly protein Flp/PilA
MRGRFKAFLSDNSGATAIEYALMASLIALVLVTVLTNLGTRLSGEFSEISAVLK